MKRLTDEQRQLAESHFRFVRGIVRSGQLGGYVARFGYDDVEGYCMVVLCESACQFDPARYHSFKEYLRWMIIRRLHSLFQKQSLQTVNGWEIDETFHADNERPSIECDERERIHKELGKLTPRQRDVVVRAVGMSEGVVAIARADGCGHNAVIVSRKNALRNLRIAYGLEKPGLKGRWYPMEGERHEAIE